MGLLMLLLVSSLQAGSTTSDLQVAVSALGSFDFVARTDAARTLRRADASAVASTLQDAVASHPDEYVRFRALVLLTGIDQEAAREAVRAAMTDRNDRLRTVAYQWYERHPDPGVLPRLLEALPDETSEFVRPALTRALAAHADDPRARQALLPLVTRGEDLFRGSVISALGDHRATFALEAIAAVARLEGPLQDDAVTALGRIGDESVLGALAVLQGNAPQEVQPAVSAALCLLEVDCGARKAYLVDTLRFGVANDGYQPLLRGAVHALGVLASAGHVDAMRALVAAANGASERARAPIALGLAVAAVRRPSVVLDAMADAGDVDATAALLLEGFDMLSEDFDEEQFYVETRRAFWQSTDDGPRREAAARLIEVLEF